MIQIYKPLFYCSICRGISRQSDIDPLTYYITPFAVFLLLKRTKRIMIEIGVIVIDHFNENSLGIGRICGCYSDGVKRSVIGDVA